MSAIRHQPPTFEAESLEIAGVAVVVVRGEIDLVTAPQFDAAVAEAILDHGTPRPLLVDLAECQFMDSSGLAVLLRAGDKLGGRLAVACPAGAPAARLLELAAHNLLPRHGTREEALAALE
jgi:anti-sigma B factor antagonist